MLITYNHEKYISQTLDSLLMQETEYNYEINVIEDCSTDRTQEIVMHYVEKYPDKVKPFFNKKNIGYKVTQKNFYRGFKTLKGDYLAIIEGDDYWTSPHKLQKQVSFLEANPEYVACAHNVIKIYEGEDRERHRFLYWENLPQEYTIEDMIHMRAYFHITTLMFRNVFRSVPPPQFENRWSCEIFVTIAHAQFGKIRYFDEDMSVYRAHAGGRFSNMKILDSWFFNIGGLRRYNAWLGYRHLNAFSGSIVRYCNVVLNDAGKAYETPPLTVGQTAKYASIRLCYQLILDVFSTRDRIKSSYNEWRKTGSFGRRLLLLPFHAAKIVMQWVIMILGNFFSYLYQFGSKFVPLRLKKVLRKLSAPLTKQKNVRALYWLWNEGKLFTPECEYQFKMLAHFCVYIFSHKLIGLAERSLPESIRGKLWRIAYANEKLHRNIRTQWLSWPIRCYVDIIQHVRTFSENEDIAAVRWLWKEGTLFTNKGAFHIRKAVGFYARKLWFGAGALPYMLASRLASTSLKNSVRSLDESHENLRYFRQLLREGRLLTRSGALHCLNMTRSAARKILYPRKGAANNSVLIMETVLPSARREPQPVTREMLAKAS